MRTHSVVVLVDDLDAATARAIQYARTLQPDDLRAVHFDLDSWKTSHARRGMERPRLQPLPTRHRRVPRPSRSPRRTRAGVADDCRRRHRADDPHPAPRVHQGVAPDAPRPLVRTRSSPRSATPRTATSRSCRITSVAAGRCVEPLAPPAPAPRRSSRPSTGPAATNVSTSDLPPDAHADRGPRIASAGDGRWSRSGHQGPAVGRQPGPRMHLGGRDRQHRRRVLRSS